MSITITGGKASDVKDPDAVLDYVFDWSAWLAGNTPPETLAQHEVIVVGCTLLASMRADGKVTARIGGGTVGTAATVTCRITTNTGQVDDRTLTLKIKET
jgi:hypothetical protein